MIIEIRIQLCTGRSISEDQSVTENPGTDVQLDFRLCTFFRIL